MGGGRWDDDSYKTYSSTRATMSLDQRYTAKSVQKELDVKKILTPRESRDSKDNPNSTPIILGVDVTGSMGNLADIVSKTLLGQIFSRILNEKIVPDPQVMIMGIGDAECDKQPLQVSQFESDLTITKWLEMLFLERGGGGNAGESYNLAHYFAAKMTSTDSFEKRKKKGFLFTIGDEPPLLRLRKSDVKKHFDWDESEDIGSAHLYKQASEKYHVFHIILAQDRKSSLQSVKNIWETVMDDEHIIVNIDYNMLSDQIIDCITKHSQSSPVDKVQSQESEIVYF